MKTLVTFMLSFFLLAVSSTDSFAQKKIKFDREGKATVSTTVKANSKLIYSVSGKEFATLQITQTAGVDFKYELKRGSEFLSSGHTTGSNITLNSDGKSTYTIIIINGEDKANPITLSITKTGGGSDI